MEDEVFDHMNEQFPCPRLSKTWVAKTTVSIRERPGPAPDVSWGAFVEEIDNAALSAPFSTSTEPGTGLSPTLSLPTMCTAINRPIVLELVHLTDIGASAFSLERVRVNRDKSFHLQLYAMAGEGEIATLEKLAEIRDSLPPYPRKCLKLYLSDGTRELEAVELEQLDIHLGRTPMGTKVELFGFPVIEGIAYLRRANVNILGGAVEAMEHPHQVRLISELYNRMQAELVVAKDTGVDLPNMFSECGVSDEA